MRRRASSRFRSTSDSLVGFDMIKTPTYPQLPERDRFYHTFGKALSHWALVEYYLSLLFGYASGLEYLAAQEIFFSGRSFQSRGDLLSAALLSSKLSPEWRDYVAKVLLKAISYNGFRNQLAHNAFQPDARDDHGRPIEWKLKPPYRWNAKGGISASQIEIAASNFADFAWAIMDALIDIENKTPPTAHLEQLLRLPNEADSSQPSQKQLGRLRQLKASQRKSKRHSQG